MTSLLERLLACFVEPAPPREPPEVAMTSRPAPSSLDAAARRASQGEGLGRHALESAGNHWLPPSDAVAVGGDLVAPTGSVMSPSAAVVGASARAVLPVAAAAAGELRVRARTAAALVALWHPAAVAAMTAAATGIEEAIPERATGTTRAVTPTGAATPAARRLEARLADDGSGPATSCGRIAWLLLPSTPSAAAATAANLLARSGAPVVLAVCGPRPAALEPLLAACDVAVAVLPADADPDLRGLALAALSTPRRAIHPPLAPGPPRWAALAGLARLRSLPRSVGDEVGR